MLKRHYVIKDDTRKRCKIVTATPDVMSKLIAINMELFHFMYESPSIDFTLYIRAADELIEFIQPQELSHELLDQLAAAMKKDYDDVEVCVRRGDLARYRNCMNVIRRKKIDDLIERQPDLDAKTLECFSDLSSASQMIVRGGLTEEVVERAKASAFRVVTGLMDSAVAVFSLSKMVQADPTLYDHSASVAMIAGVIASRLLRKPLNESESHEVALAGLYHDVGKTCIPNAVLNKPERFTPAEYEVMKTHTNLGHDELMDAISKGAPIGEIVARVAMEHHERFSGSGYPHSRRGRLEDDADNGIHLYTRIVTIADVYSALLMKRVYKPAYEPMEAIKIMANGANDYDPEIFIPFLETITNGLHFNRENGGGGGKGSKTGKILIIEDGKVSKVG